MGKEKISPFAQLGSTGLKAFSGQIYEEEHPKLRGTKALRTFREMRDNSAIVGAILHVTETMFRQLNWPASPANESQEAHRLADFVESCMNDMSHTWDDFICEVLSMLYFGHSYFEIVYKIRKQDSKRPELNSFNDGLIGWKKLGIRDQESIWKWNIDDDGSILGATQQAPPHYQQVFLPIEKCLLFRVKSHKNNPQGRLGGILRNSYRSWFFAKRLQEVEASGIERDLSGYPVMELPMHIIGAEPGTQEANIRAHMENMIQRIRRDEDEGATVPAELDSQGMPTGYKLKLLSTGGNRVHDTNSIIKRYETRISQSVLAEFIMLGTESVGSFALSSCKTNVFMLTMGALRDSILSVLNRYAIPRLMKVNKFNNPELYPEITTSDFGNEDITLMSDYISKLASVGAIELTPEIERRLLELAKLPIKD